jgi:hypothetical protein
MMRIRNAALAAILLASLASAKDKSVTWHEGQLVEVSYPLGGGMMARGVTAYKIESDEATYEIAEDGPFGRRAPPVRAKKGPVKFYIEEKHNRPDRLFIVGDDGKTYKLRLSKMTPRDTTKGD